MEPFVLRKWRLEDAESLAEQANNIKIWNNVRDYFPHPYSLQDGKEYIGMVLSQSNPAVNLAIAVEGKAVGGVGMVIFNDVERVTAEIGYWLGERYWGRGIMTGAVKQMSQYVFQNFDVIKLFAPVFEFNTASMRVLEKAGYQKEAILKKAAVKNGKIIDIHYYSLFKQTYHEKY
ncbi:MAG: GNAT family N-acetyltransferase [Bacteroidales bacterium]|jgi:RimJ/RimL family protein N-acetyltransferase|nr:GNAT family N-acetyltransferase [Bacteroidales bacterium]